MTTELVIMNREAVAIAADSAATVSGAGKVYPTAQKICCLSEQEPVGIIVYGDAEFMGVPWDTVLHVFRERAMRPSDYRHLQLVADRLLSFLRDPNAYFRGFVDRDAEKSYVKNLAEELVLSQVIMQLQAQAEEDEIDLSRRTGARKEFLSAFLERAKGEVAGQLAELTKERPGEVAPAFKALESRERLISQFISKSLSEIPFVPQSRVAEFQELAHSWMKLFVASPEHGRDSGVVDSYSGVVVAGFGRDDKFPSLVSYKFGGHLSSHLVYSKDEYDNSENVISLNNRSAIFPFAQKNTIEMFLSSIDQEYQESILSTFDHRLSRVIARLIARADRLSQHQQGKLRSYGKELFRNEARAFRTEVWKPEFERELWIQKIVAILPQDELASMAETLVNLTSFDRRLSPGPETVGGPTDVVSLSKAGGFKWVKRKSATCADNDRPLLRQ